MEGNMWKWTNYWNGWKPRWFVLSETGVLSYYSSFEEVDQGCKGSMNVAACEIIVSQNDNTRLDIVVSHEKYLYLRAKDDKERQRWLVSLGSAKASVSKTNTHGRSRLSSASPIPIPATSCTQPPLLIPPSNKISDFDKTDTAPSKTSTDLIKAKRSELRLYCDLLMQQVHMIKTAVQTNVEPASGKVDIDKLDEGCSLLAQTCDTFIHTLDETMKLSVCSNVQSSHNGDEVITPTLSIQQTTLSQNGGKQKFGRTISFDESSRLSSVSEQTHRHQAQTRHQSMSPVFNSYNESRSKPSSNNTKINPDSENHSKYEIKDCQANGFMGVFGGSNAPKEGVNFFSEKSPHFTENENENVFFNQTSTPYEQLSLQNNMEHTLKPSFPISSESTGIDTRQFILASQGAIKIFDFLGPKSFAPIRSEVSGHIVRIKTKFESDPMEFATLKDIVEIEIRNKVAEQTRSASCSLLWLVRYLMFIHEFLRRFAESDINADTLIKDCLCSAYESCLRKYHTPVIHNVFSIALEASPCPRIFLDSLGRINTYNNDSTSFTKEISWTKRNDWRNLFQVNLLPELGKYLDSMETCLMLFMNFYQTTQLSEKT